MNQFFLSYIVIILGLVTILKIDGVQSVQVDSGEDFKRPSKSVLRQIIKRESDEGIESARGQSSAAGAVQWKESGKTLKRNNW